MIHTAIILLGTALLLFAVTSRAEASSDVLELDVARGTRDHLLLVARHSEIGLALEMWCFEAGAFHDGTGEKRDDGSVVFLYEAKGLVATTTFTPVGTERIVMEMVVEGTPEALGKADYLGPCHWHAEAFMRDEGLADFAERCFLYTARGPVGVLETARGAMKGFDPDGEENNPPWTQWYVPLTRQHPGDIWAFGASGERPTHSLVGGTSRDGKWLSAIGSPNVRNLGQGWHDCIHHVPELSYDIVESEGVIRHKTMLYVMPNDPKALLDAYRQDFANYEATTLVVEPNGAGLTVSTAGDSVELKLEGKGWKTAYGSQRGGTRGS